MADATKPVQVPVPKPRPRKNTGSVSTASLETSSGGSGASASRRSGNSESSDCESQLKVVEESVGRLRGEQTCLLASVGELKREKGELEETVRRLREEEGNLKRVCEDRERDVTSRLRELEQRVSQLREEEAKLGELSEEKMRQGTGMAEDRLREMELQLQHRLDEASDRESANRQESMRLQRLADQLHMQKKELEHRAFDLENFGGEGSDVIEERQAELKEKEQRLRQLEVEVSAKERELDLRQANFQKWMKEQQTLVEQRLADLNLGGQNPPPPSSQSYPPPPSPQSYPPPPSSPYHTVTPSHAYTHQFTGSPRPSYHPTSSHYTPHNSTQPQHAMYGHQYTSPQNIPTHASSNEGSLYGTPARTGGGVFYADEYGNTYGSTGYSASPQGDGSRFNYPVSSSGRGQFTASAYPLSASGRGQFTASAYPLSSSGRGQFTASAYPVSSGGFTATYSSTATSSPVSVSASSQSHGPTFGTDYNDLSVHPLQRNNQLPAGIIKSGSAGYADVISGVGVASGGMGVAGGGVGVASGGGGVVSGGASSSGYQPSPSGRPRINMDEELARNPPSQTTDEISADAEYARRLDKQLNTAATTLENDRELALALMATDLQVPTTDTIPDLSSQAAVQSIIENRLRQEELRKLQEERDAELARTLEGPHGSIPPNDL